MNMRHFIAIEAVAEEKSFSKAAQKLYITQQALSKTIQQAEKECGRPLFVRQSHGVSITPEGERLYSIIFPLLTEYKVTHSRLDRFLQYRESTEIQIGVAVGTMYSIGYEICIQMQNHLRNAFPEIAFTFSEAPDLVIEERVASGTLDFALTLQPEKHKSLLFNSILSIPITALFPEDHPLSSRSSVSLKELKDCAFILPSRDMQFYNYTINKCLNAGFKPKIRHECVDATTALFLVKSGEGIFLGLDVFLNSDGVKKVPLKENDFNWINGLLYTKKCLTEPTYTRIFRVISDHLRLYIDRIRSHESIDIVRWHDNL